MAYVKIGEAFFQESTTGLMAVDANTATKLKTGALPYTTQATLAAGANRFAGTPTQQAVASAPKPQQPKPSTSPATSTPAPTTQSPLPQSSGNSLLDFSNTLSQAVNLAKQKRNALSLNFMAPFQGTVAASDFNSILSGLNNASNSLTGDLIKSAKDAAATPAYTEVSPGATLFDPKTGKAIYTAPTPASAPNSNIMTDNERALFAQFRSEPIVKDYNTILQKKLSVEGIVASGVGGPQDLSLVYEFMKALDPTSVVRETEYATAAKSGNIFLGALAKFNGYFKESGGFLPENVRKEFLSIVNTKFNVQSKLYANTVTEYQRLAKSQGLDPNNVIINYDNAAPSAGGSGSSNLGDLDFTF